MKENKLPESGTYFTSQGNVILQFETHDITEKETKTRDEIINDFIDETFTDTEDFIETLYGDNQDESMLSAMTEYEKWYGEDSGSIYADDRALNYLSPLSDAIYRDIFEFDYNPLAEKLDIDIDDDEEMNDLIWEVVDNIEDRIIDYLKNHSIYEKIATDIFVESVDFLKTTYGDLEKAICDYANSDKDDYEKKISDYINKILHSDYFKGEMEKYGDSLEMETETLSERIKAVIVKRVLEQLKQISKNYDIDEFINSFDDKNTNTKTKIKHTEQER